MQSVLLYSIDEAFVRFDGNKHVDHVQVPLKKVSEFETEYLLETEVRYPEILHSIQDGPFNVNVFEAKMHNLIQAKQIFKHWYSQSVLMEPDHVFVRNMDGEFIIRLKNLILENISDPGFGVKEMSRQMGTSVAVLYRKLRDLTGMTVNDFVKGIRMARAMQLLGSGEYHVSEAAVIVGYESSKYFGKGFKKFFGKTPVEVRRQPPL